MSQQTSLYWPHMSPQWTIVDNFLSREFHIWVPSYFGQGAFMCPKWVALNGSHVGLQGTRIWAPTNNNAWTPYGSNVGYFTIFVFEFIYFFFLFLFDWGSWGAICFVSSWASFGGDRGTRPPTFWRVGETISNVPPPPRFLNLCVSPQKSYILIDLD